MDFPQGLEPELHRRVQNRRRVAKRPMGLFDMHDWAETERSMAGVIHLAEGEHPPEKKNCVVVLRDAAGGFFVLSSADSYQRELSPSAYPILDAERTAAIERAKAFADSHEIETVYVDPE